MSLLGDIVAGIMAAVGGRKMSRAELESALDDLAIKNPERLDWRHSIVDLLKLVGRDSSLLARERLASELGYQGHFNGDPQLNIWLHHQVMQGLADHPGRLPG